MSTKENILVSVLLPAYNAEKYLAEAIQSVLDQTYSNFELIIINDGSSDSTAEIIKSFTDHRIKYVSNGKNIGLIATLNKGILLAQGELLMRMDADDVCLPMRMEKQLVFLMNNIEVGVCGCNYIEFGKRSERKVALSTDHNEIYAKMLFNSSMVHPSLMVRMSLFKGMPTVFDGRFSHAEDYELWSRLILKCKFSNVNNFLFKYRLHEGQITQKYKSAQIESANNVRRNLLQLSGFTFSEEELRVHCLLGSSQLIRTADDLFILENWLKKLLHQNGISKKIDQKVFMQVIGKMWYDGCGITTLGHKAYRTYFRSDLQKLYAGSKSKLLVKCMLRKWA